MAPLRLVFFGTADLACPSLQVLAKSPSCGVAAVVTQPDRPRGRTLRAAASPVKTLAQTLALPILQPERARSPDFLATLSELQPQLIIVAAYGQLLPPPLLALPQFGCLNVHASLLPKYRGAAPIQWAILNGDPHTGVTIMRMDAGLDTGDILAQRSIPILPSDDARFLHDRLAQLGAALLDETIPVYVGGQLHPQPQPALGVSYARKLTREDGQLDWGKPALQLWRQVRAFNPWPGAYSFLLTSSKAVLLKIWQADVLEKVTGRPGTVSEAGPERLVVGCGEESLAIRMLQREGGRRMTAREFLAGFPVKVGAVLGGP